MPEAPGPGRSSPGAATAEPNAATVLLTGATGFIGRRLQQALTARGYRVRALARSDSPRIANVEPGVEVFDGALGDRQTLSRSVVGTTAVINCAGIVRGNCFEDFEPANVAGVRSLCEVLAGLSRPPALLHLSSLAAEQPGLSDYARSKHEGERVLGGFEQLNWCVIRPPAVYGPGDVEMRGTLGWIRRGLVPVAGADRAQRLSLLHVDDLCGAALAWLAAPEKHNHRIWAIDDGAADGYDWEALAAAIAGRRPLFVGLPTGAMMALAGLNERLARLTGRKVMLSRGKVRELTHPRWVAADTEGFASVSGWRPTIALADGVRGLFES